MMTRHSGRIVRFEVGPAAAQLVVAGLFGTLLCGPHPSAAAQVAPAELQNLNACESAEACFTAAAWPKERLGNVLTKDQVVAIKLERLRRVMERFPASLWAKRAGLLSGVLLVDRNPAAALAFLRAAQRDFPVLEDYVRLWQGEALLHLNDAKEAAFYFESVPQAVPDSNLLPRATLRAGEAWYQASDCPAAMKWLAKAIGLNDKDPQVSQAWLRLAACYLRENGLAEGRATLKQLWVRFPQTKEAKEAEALLGTNLGGEVWVPQADDYYARAQVFLGQALHGEAVEELKKFLAAEPTPGRRGDAKLKMGVALVRLKQYDQARELFRALAAEPLAQSDEATVWLARVYLRQGLGDKLLELSRTLEKRPLSREQRGQILLFAGMWLEDQTRFDEAVLKYRQAAKSGEPASQRAEALWREGWVFYRSARNQEAIEVWQRLADQQDGEFEPQALYWLARTYTDSNGQRSRELYVRLCQRFPYTYYCQLARDQIPMNPSELVAPEASLVGSPQRDPSSDDGRALSLAKRMEIDQEPAYRRALELKRLGLDQDAARELTALTDRYSREPDVLMALSMMLNEVGAHHQALRLARARFRDRLERTGGPVAAELWNVAYPTGLIPTIKSQGTIGVDPFLVAAIIREESQYDWRAVSRVGAIGLMQVMPTTANTVAQQYRLPAVAREDLFDQETNIRIGARYVEQLLGQFSGNVVYTIAAYNAGPIAVGNWISLHGNRTQDEFVELIPYQETRQYVKRVLRSYKEYVRLAGQS
jgi:soluble lytic murein transglycosylase